MEQQWQKQQQQQRQCTQRPHTHAHSRSQSSFSIRSNARCANHQFINGIANLNIKIIGIGIANLHCLELDWYWELGMFSKKVLNIRGSQNLFPGDEQAFAKSHGKSGFANDSAKKFSFANDLLVLINFHAKVGDEGGFCKKDEGRFCTLIFNFCTLISHFCKKSRLAKSNANLIGYEQTTYVRSRSSMIKKSGVGARVKPNQTAAKQKTLLRISQHCKVFRAQKRAALAEK